MKKKIIGINAQSFTKNTTGIGIYVLSLLEYLMKEFTEYNFILYSNKNIFLPEKIRTKVILREERNSIFRKFPGTVWLKFFSWRLMRSDKLDFFISSNGFFPSFLSKNVKRVAIVHDINYILFPKTMGKLHLLSHKLFFLRDVISADFIIANSVGTSKKINQHTNKNINAIINPIIDKIFRRIDEDEINKCLNELKINYPYFLSVGTLEPRKNLEFTIALFLEFKKKHPDSPIKLILVGMLGWKNKKLRQLIDNNAESVIQIGYIERKYLPYLYNGATLFLFPSIYEGFGIPIRESLACGTPVLTTNIEELKESGGNYGVIYLDNFLIDKNIENLINGQIKITPQTFEQSEEALNKFINYFK